MLPTRRHPAMSKDIFGCHNLGAGLLLASSGWESGMSLSTLQGRESPSVIMPRVRISSADSLCAPFFSSHSPCWRAGLCGLGSVSQSECHWLRSPGTVQHGSVLRSQCQTQVLSLWWPLLNMCHPYPSTVCSQPFSGVIIPQLLLLSTILIISPLTQSANFACSEANTFQRFSWLIERDLEKGSSQPGIFNGNHFFRTWACYLKSVKWRGLSVLFHFRGHWSIRRGLS